MTRPPLALTMGEPGGIARNITVQAWRTLRTSSDSPFCVLTDPDFLREFSEPQGIDVVEVSQPEDAASCFADGIPVIAVTLAGPVTVGGPTPVNAPAVIASITDAVSLCVAGRVAAVVTNPIDKHSLHTGANFQHSGHTDFLAHLAGGSTAPVMMMVADSLRVVPVTTHIPLAAVPAVLTTDRIVDTCRTTAGALVEQFGIASPRLAVTGLNPHAGENGVLGEEDSRIIHPAIEALRALDIAASGPYSADALFAPHSRDKFDAAICMYHDQALIPIKALAFQRCVNVTLGLPIVRTSPGHGVAYDIAGSDGADASSLLAAIEVAEQLAAT